MKSIFLLAFLLGDPGNVEPPAPPKIYEAITRLNEPPVQISALPGGRYWHTAYLLDDRTGKNYWMPWEVADLRYATYELEDDSPILRRKMMFVGFPTKAWPTVWYQFIPIERPPELPVRRP